MAFFFAPDIILSDMPEQLTRVKGVASNTLVFRDVPEAPGCLILLESSMCRWEHVRAPCKEDESTVLPRR